MRGAALFILIKIDDGGGVEENGLGLKAALRAGVPAAEDNLQQGKGGLRHQEEGEGGRGSGGKQGRSQGGGRPAQGR